MQAAREVLCDDERFLLGGEAAIRSVYRTINELNQTNRDQADEINLLKAENAQIKAQALQQNIND